MTLAKRMTSVGLCAAIALLLAGQCYAQMTPQQAFEAGRTVGNTQAPTSQHLVRGAGAAASMPGAGTATQSQYFLNGQGSTSGPGLDRQAECATADAQGLAGYGGKSCDATNFLTRNPQTRPNVTINRNDRLITNIPSTSILGTGTGVGIGGGGQPSVCTTTQQSGTTTYTNEVCHEDAVLVEQKCIVGQTVTVSQGFVYECNTQPRRLSTVSCDKVTSEACTSSLRTETCPNGSTPANGICTSSTTTTDTAAVSYSCPAGQTLSGNQCVATETTNASVASYTCPAGQTLSGNQCVTSTTETIGGTPNYACPAGQTLSGNQCLSTETIGANVSSYLCPVGQMPSGNQCVTSTTDTIGGTPNYLCPAGQTLSGSQCLATETIGANVGSYSCPAGQTLSGNQCFATETIPVSVNNTCPSGYTLSDSSCTRQVPSAATPVYACPSGYTLSGTSCSRPVSSAATVASYSCPAGYTVSGSSCSRTTTSSAPATPVYACPSSYTLSGTSCSRQVSNSAVESFSCRAGGTLLSDGRTCSYVVTTNSEANEAFSCSASGARLTPGVIQGGRQTYVCCTESTVNQCQALEGLVR